MFSSVAQSCPTLSDPMDCSMPGFLFLTISQSLPKVKSIESMILSSHLTLCHTLLLLPSVFPSIKVFSNELALHISWPKYWSCSFSFISSNEYSGLISFRIDWFDLLAVQGTLQHHSFKVFSSTIVLQHHSSKASVLQGSAFFMIQLSHLYMTTGKTATLTIWTIASKVMPLLFNTLSKFVMLPSGSGVKNPLANAGNARDTGLTPGSGRLPGGGHGNPHSSNPVGKIPWTKEPGRL